MRIDDIPFKPTSKEYLAKLFQQVFVPLQFGQSVSLVTFAGAGKWANIRFIIDNIPYFDEEYPQTAYLYLNAKNLAYSAIEEVQNGITFMLAKAIIQKNELAKAFAEKNVKYETPLLFAQSFLRLVREYNQRLVVVVDEAEALFVPDRVASNAITFLQTLVNIEVTKISFLFITKAEVTEAPENLRNLHKFYFQHVVTERSIPFDEECGHESLSLFENIHKKQLSTVAKQQISTLTKGDPLMLKFLFMEYFSNSQVQEILNTPSASIDQLFKALDSNYLRERYQQIVDLSSPLSRDFLYGLSTRPTQFLMDSNLITTEDKISTPLFQYFLNKLSTRFSLVPQESLLLTPREERVLNLLQDSLGKVVSREDIAKSLWGESWQSQYSEESVDKVVSSIRNKLLNSSENPLYSIKSAKGVGILLERSR